MNDNENNKIDNNKNKHCEKCNKTFTSNTHLRIHYDTELHKTGQRKIRTNKKEDLKCDICNLYTTRQTTNLKVHILNNHSTPKKRKEGFKFYCEDCDYGIDSENKYLYHLETIKHKMKNSNKTT